MSTKLGEENLLRKKVWIKPDTGGKEIELSLEDIQKEGLLNPGKKDKQ